jgi:hypothetical protein
MRVYFAFQLVFDNYAEAGCSDASPAASQSMKIPENTSLDVSSCPDSMKREMEDLQQQLQSMKKQTMTALEQTRKSSDREQAALLRAQESLELEKAATAKATRAAERAGFMLDLMTRYSQDMAGTIFFSHCTQTSALVLFLPLICSPLLHRRFFFGSRCRRSVGKLAG